MQKLTLTLLIETTTLDRNVRTSPFDRILRLRHHRSLDDPLRRRPGLRNPRGRRDRGLRRRRRRRPSLP